MNTENELEISIMDVVLVEPGKPPQIKTIENNLRSMQRIVGGNIQTYPLEDGAVLVCDEEGKLKNKPINRAIRIYDSETGEFKTTDVIVGTFFVCYAPEGSEEFFSLPLELQKKFVKLFVKNLRWEVMK